MMTVG